MNLIGFRLNVLISNPIASRSSSSALNNLQPSNSRTHKMQFLKYYLSSSIIFALCLTCSYASTTNRGYLSYEINLKSYNKTRDRQFTNSQNFDNSPDNDDRFHHHSLPWPLFLQRQTGSFSSFNPYSCRNRCDTKGHSIELPCQCNFRCVDYKDCCADYIDICLSCVERCDEGVDQYDSDFPCQCNKACNTHNDCCNDYMMTCNSDDSATDAELQTLSEALLSLDVNNCANLVSVNQQGSTSFHSHRDNAPLPLLTVQSSAYNKPTISKLLPLHNNYVATVGDAEVVTNQETQEETAFLDAIMPTTVMKRAEKFLVDKGFISTRRRLSNGSYRNNNRAFRDAIHQIWFGLYSRENRTLGSSGFEHVFLGEIKQEKVQGFHNWVFFSKEEQNNNLNYKGKIGSNVSLGNKGMIVKHKFDWIGKEKPISSMFVGTSPEFEIALYTVCFYARPGSRCPVKLNGKDINIQTHYSYRQGKRYVGSAFPDI